MIIGDTSCLFTRLEVCALHCRIFLTSMNNVMHLVEVYQAIEDGLADLAENIL